MTKKVYIKVFGCQMNVRDSEVICGLLEKAGYGLTDSPDKAGIILFNTCSVRQHAEDRVWSEIGRHKDGKIIGVLGCMAQNYKEKIFERAPNVDFVVGPSDIDKVPGIITRVCRYKLPDKAHSLNEAKIWETGGEKRTGDIYHTGFYADKDHAFVVISEGCSNYCSYCVVPYVRGEIRHRMSRDILKEIEEALDKGITKVTLLGQNVNAYSDGEVNFVKLLQLVNRMKGLQEFSFITSHPKNTAVDLFKAMAELEKLKKYLHLPLQSGSDRILKLMNRGYSRKFYLDLIEEYRKIVKKAVLTTDIIVGFPTETEDDFRDTYDALKGVEFDCAYIFKYSPRTHTEAEKLDDDVVKKDKEKRHKLILELQKEISRRKKCENTF
ncbi:MAG: tRNA (N6-isopentenyl adenosine(37)-C2)-methylthiotransferase MiaB [Candidatus Omnitrophica bacterium]|nr:tRNA (N6-isopentenyl adenosine(37)-C2)-methylthiotransferase MiaB [Candidatus Omnitrophota bacterium]